MPDTAIDNLTAKVAKNGSLVGSIVALVHGIVAELNKLREQGATADQISALADNLESQDIALANAILEGTTAQTSQIPPDATPGGAVSKADIIANADPTAIKSEPATGRRR